MKTGSLFQVVISTNRIPRYKWLGFDIMVEVFVSRQQKVAAILSRSGSSGWRSPGSLTDSGQD